MNNGYQNAIGGKWRGYFLTAYGIAVKHGFVGSEEEWLLSITAYGLAVKLGFEGTMEEWIASLKGEKGDKGDPFTYEDFTEEQIAALKSGIVEDFLKEAGEIKTSVEAAETRAGDSAVSAIYAADAARSSEEAALSAANDAQVRAAEAEKSAKEADLSRRVTTNNLKTAMTAHKKVFEHAWPNKAMELIHGGCVELDGYFFETDYCYYTNKIAVSAGETITYQATSIEDDERSIVRITNVTAYDAEDNVLADLGATEVYSYVVPEGVAYIICSIFVDNVDKYFEWAIAASDTVIPCSYILKPSAIPYLGNNYSNALRGTVFGETVSVSDVSPIEHDLCVKVNSKNLFHFVKDTNVTFNGLKITAVANSSSFTADGTSTYSSIIGYPFSPMLLPAGTYTLSISDVPFSDKEGDDRIHINGKNLLTGSSTVLAYILFDGTKKKTTFTITETWEVFVNFLFSPGRTWENQEFTVQLEKGTEASGYAPYVDAAGVTVSRCGKNLFIPELEIGGIAGGSGANYSNLAQLRSSVYIPISPASYCVFTTLPEYFSISAIFVYDKNKNQLVRHEQFTEKVINLSAYAVGYVRLRIAKRDGTDMTEEDVELAKTAFQIELGDTATEYEPYIEPVTAMADSDGNVTGLISVSPNMTLTSDTENVIIECEYNRDLMKVIEELTQAIISLGGNI